MKKLIVFVFVLVLFSVTAVQTSADELAELKEQLNQQQKMIEQQNQMLQQMMARIEQLESQNQQQEQRIEARISETVEKKQVSALPDSMKWVENIKWSGDLRYRHETIDDDTAATDRDRNRIRARLKLEARINDEWDAIFRIASGSSDSPTSTNQTLGDSSNNDDSFSSRHVWLDWAYADYHPAWMPGLNVFAGKMANPFYTVGKNQLIFDGDLSLEGGAATYAWNLNDSTSATVAGGGFWVRERSTDADTSIFGVQGMLKHKLSSDSHILGGVSYYDFGNIKGKTLSGISSKGNTTTGGLYANDYDIIEGFGEYGFKIGSVPVAVFGSYVQNIDSTTNDDTAWLIGAKYNKAKKPGSWEASYNYRDVEKDAVVGGLCDSDFIGGGTNGTGHVFGFKYQLAKNVQAAIHYFLNDKNESTTSDEYKMLQADLIWKF